MKYILPILLILFFGMSNPSQANNQFQKCSFGKIFCTDIFDAARKGDIEFFEEYLKAGGNLNIQDRYGNSLFHHAASKDQIAVIQFLIEKNVNPNITDDLGWTPLHRAAWENHQEIVFKLLFEAGVNPDIKNKQGHTALHLAAQKNYVEIVEFLIQAKAQLEIQDNYDNTALYYAIRNNHQKTKEALIQAGAKDPNCFLCN